MPHSSFLRKHGKVARPPRRPFEKERLDNEMKLIGEFGLKNKREVWRTQLTLARIRKAARTLLTLDEKDTKRMFEGGALLRRLLRLGVLDEQHTLAIRREDETARGKMAWTEMIALAAAIFAVDEFQRPDVMPALECVEGAMGLQQPSGAISLQCPHGRSVGDGRSSVTGRIAIARKSAQAWNFLNFIRCGAA